MRVVLLSGNAPRHNAVGNQIAEKVRFFQERGAEVRLLVQDARSLHHDLLSCTLEMRQPLSQGPAWDELRQADLVLAVYAQYFALLQLLPCLVGQGPRIVFDYLGVTPSQTWHDQHREGLERSAKERGFVWCADHALTTSWANAQELHLATHFPLAHTTTLPLPVDLERFQSEPGERYLQQRLDITGRILLYVGRLAGNKRVPLLIEALARLDDRSIHCVIVGDTSDVYAAEATHCQSLAEQLGLAQRVHFLGQLDTDELPRAYRSADVLVMPSVHEGFCLPVIEAMACGLPVVASRSAALPETVGDAGLTFAPNDVEDLIRQLRRVLATVPEALESEAQAKQPTQAEKQPRRVAVVSFRFGPDIVGGAETSLRTMARALQEGGHPVEVYTTCATSESHWRNEAPAGDVILDGLCVHRFPIDAHDAPTHGDVFRSILEADGRVSSAIEARYLASSLHSSALVAALRARVQDFDAIITGPYLFGLTADIAREFPDKTLVVPCFHDEALARLPGWPRRFGDVGGILFHSPEEQAYAQAQLGLNHPNAHEVGTIVTLPAARNPKKAPTRPYVVYCGRFSEQKNLPLLLDWARRYQAENPGQVDFWFMGRGDLHLPREPWLRDLGRVDEAAKQKVLAEAAALVQLSTQESLSLVVLEAWAQATPVIVHDECAVLAAQVARADGGKTVSEFTGFAEAVSLFCRDAAARNAHGKRGLAYVEQQYASTPRYLGTLIQALDALAIPLHQQMRTRGLARARHYGRPVWQQRFAEFIESLLIQPPRGDSDELSIEPLRERIQATTGTRTTLLPVRLVQRGFRASTPEGPGRTVICCEVCEDATGAIVERSTASLPGLLLPGQPRMAALPVTLPNAVGPYSISLRVECIGSGSAPAVEIPLTIAAEASTPTGPGAAVFLDTVQETLPLAHHLQQLPTDYVDVTEGVLAPAKRLIKQKLLNNFKHAYVDVLSRQQSQVNGHVVLMIQQLAECCAMLDHAVAGLHQRIDGLEAKLEQALVEHSDREAGCAH